MKSFDAIIMDPHSQTSLKTELKWGLGTVLVVGLVMIAGFALFMTRVFRL